MCVQLRLWSDCWRHAHAELACRADDYTWIFALTVIFAFIAAFGIGALRLTYLLCVTSPGWRASAVWRRVCII